MPRPSRRSPHQVGDRQRRLAEEGLAALLLEDEERALDGTDARLGDVAVAGGELAGAIGDIGEQRLEVLEVEEQQTLLVGDLEGDVEHALLGVVEIEETGREGADPSR